nr:MAG TPA: hypothetical protein [Caudoviricetes sp.]
MDVYLTGDLFMCAQNSYPHALHLNCFPGLPVD